MVGCFPAPGVFQARVGSERQPLFLGNWLLFWFFRDSWKSVFFFSAFSLSISTVDGRVECNCGSLSNSTKVLGSISHLRVDPGG